MRIAFITYEYPYSTGKGGIGTYTSQVASMLTMKGWDVHVFAGSDAGPGVVQENGINIHLIQCSSPHDFRLNVVPVFQQQHSIQPFDVMESPEIHGNASEIKKTFPQIPLVVRLHAPNYLVEHLKKKYIPFTAKARYVLGALRRFRFDMGYWRAYDKSTDPDFQFIRLADCITAPSEPMKQWAVQHWNIEAGKIHVTPNIFTPPAALLAIPIPVNCPYKTVLFFGRLNVLKGLVNAAKAMKKILHSYPGWTFKLIGDDGPGPYAGIGMREWIEKQLKSYKDRVSFRDGLPYEALPDAITGCEIVLLPGLFESFSYTCAEAMAAGKAVVGSRNTGMAGMIENNRSGILVDANSVTGIYKALEQLIEDNELRYRIAVHARESISSKYPAEKLAQQYIGLYEGCRKQ